MSWRGAMMLPGGWSIAALAGFAVLFLGGSSLAHRWVCGNCGNSLTGPSVNLCPTCRAKVQGSEKSNAAAIVFLIMIGTIFAVAWIYLRDMTVHHQQMTDQSMQFQHVIDQIKRDANELRR